MDAPALRPFPQRWEADRRTGWWLRGYAAGDACYDVTVALPPGEPPPGGFPLLLVMDGALHFDAVASASAALARRSSKTDVLPMAVVGVASGLGWSHDAARRAGDLVPGSGDAERLMDLVRDVLLPDVMRLAPIHAAATSVFGHSLGGLFALEALAAGIVRSCVAISPSLWCLPDLVERVAAASAGLSGRLLLARGGLEPTTAPTLADAERALEGVAAVTRVEFEGEDHGSVAFAAIPAALRFVHGGRPAMTPTD